MSNPSNVISILNPQIPVDQSIYDESTTMKCRLGTKIEVADRTFRYAQAATASNLVAGRIAVAAAASTGFGTVNLTVVAAAAGATVMTCTSTALAAANDFAEGYLYVADLTSEGLMYRIKGNSAGSTGFTVTLYDDLSGAIGAASKVGISPNPYKNLTLTATGKPMGVNPIAVTSGNYYWLQTKGLANVLHAAADAAYAPLGINATAGSVIGITTGTLGSTGNFVVPLSQNQGLVSVDTECSPIFINFE